jgi:hypothetical protein
MDFTVYFPKRTLAGSSFVMANSDLVFRRWRHIQIYNTILFYNAP